MIRNDVSLLKSCMIGEESYESTNKNQYAIIKKKKAEQAQAKINEIYRFGLDIK